MLKFADLSVDFKSYENSLNSYMKLFPSSYTPLLIMYLAHKGLLKLVSEFEENDSRILVSVDGKSLHDFFGGGIMKELIPDTKVWNKEGSLEDTINLINNAILKDRDVYVMLPFIHLWPSILAGRSLALIADVSEDDQMADLIHIITESDHASDNPAALLFFSVMLMKKYEPLDEEIEDTDKHTPEEKEKKQKLEFEIWIEDFEKTLSSIISYSGNSQWIQPEELTRVILTQYKGGSIYNPFAGLASYAIQIHHLCGHKDAYVYFNIGDYYYGEEIQNLAWAIGKLRLLAYDSDSKNYNLSDSSEWRRGVVNDVFSTPPFIQIENEDGKKEFADHFVIRHGIDMLVDEGLLACVVPMSFMSRKDTADIRKRIIDEGLLESIVYLPEGIFSNTSVRTAIVFIRKSIHNQVNLVNATNAIHHRSGKVNILDEEMVANLLCHSTYPLTFEYDSEGIMKEKLPENNFEKLKFFASNDRIAKTNYDLSPGRYFIDNIPSMEGFRLIKMRDIVEGTPNNIGNKRKGKVIRPSLLSKDIFTPLLVDCISEEEFKKQYKYIEVKQDALLFSTLASLRPTLFVNPSNESVYLKSDTVQAVYLKKDSINPEYLILELNKPYVQEQVSLLTKGDVIPRLRLDDFLSIQVYVPSQKDKALLLEKEAVELEKTIYYSKVNAELAALKDKQHDEYVKMLRQRKHRIQQLMNEFTPAFNLLNQCRVKNGGILHDTDIVASRTGETVESYFSKLEHIVTKVENLVTNLVDKEHWDAASLIDIDDFVEEIPETHLSEKFKFQIFSDLNVAIEGEDEYAPIVSRTVRINKEDLSTIFDNIIANASKWGFTDSTRKDYCIRIEVSDLTEYDIPAISISFSNNGEPIHPSVDRKRFFEWGYGSGSGIGAWQMKDIIEHYGGTIELHEYAEEDTAFRTEYYIVLPLANND